MPSADENAPELAPIKPEVLPWHDVQWETLTRDIERLPHALLLHGQAGLGKNAFAARLAQLLLCLHRTGGRQPCGRCHSCVLFRAGNHPDFLYLGPQEDSRSILVDQVRNVIEFLSFKPHTAPHKIVMISPAQAMNVNAANSLLKILEEPPSGSLLVLVATHLSRVSATIRSRCMRLLFQPPPPAPALAWLAARAPKTQEPETLLAQAGGAPFMALALAQGQGSDPRAALLADLAALAMGKADPVLCAERWKSVGAEDCLERLYRFMADAIRSQAPSIRRGVVTALPQIGENLSISFIDLFRFLDTISNIRRQAGTGVDETLALEDLMIRWCEMTARAV